MEGYTDSILAKVDFTIDQNDLKCLFIHTKCAYNGYTFERWCNETKIQYSTYISKIENTKTFSQWVNGQIIALT